MSVVSYAGVVRGKTIIAALGDTAATAEKDIFKVLPPPTVKTEQKIFSNTLFTFVTTPSLTFVAASPIQVDRRKPIEFLTAISRHWTATYGAVSASAGAHALDGPFQKTFAKDFEDVNQENRTAALTRELNETQKILTESVTKAFDRGADLQNIAAKSENMKNISEEFRRQSTNLRWKMQCQFYKSWITWILAIALIFYLLLTWVCGGYSLPRCL